MAYLALKYGGVQTRLYNITDYQANTSSPGTGIANNITEALYNMSAINITDDVLNGYYTISTIAVPSCKAGWANCTPCASGDISCVSLPQFYIGYVYNVPFDVDECILTVYNKGSLTAYSPYMEVWCQVNGYQNETSQVAATANITTHTSVVTGYKILKINSVTGLLNEFNYVITYSISCIGNGLTACSINTTFPQTSVAIPAVYNSVSGNYTSDDGKFNVVTYKCSGVNSTFYSCNIASVYTGYKQYKRIVQQYNTYIGIETGFNTGAIQTNPIMASLTDTAYVVAFEAYCPSVNDCQYKAVYGETTYDKAINQPVAVSYTLTIPSTLDTCVFTAVAKNNTHKSITINCNYDLVSNTTVIEVKTGVLIPVKGYLSLNPITFYVQEMIVQLDDLQQQITKNQNIFTGNQIGIWICIGVGFLLFAGLVVYVLWPKSVTAVRANGNTF